MYLPRRFIELKRILRPGLMLAALAASGQPAASGPWRSSLYPQDWTPAFADASGRFLHDFSHAGYRRGAAP
ncbi:MAG TPA: hypothetical protein VIO38_05710, partial [Rariglobus sp.]